MPKVGVTPAATFVHAERAEPQLVAEALDRIGAF
jgi:hypothetical protein